MNLISPAQNFIFHSEQFLAVIAKLQLQRQKLVAQNSKIETFFTSVDVFGLPIEFLPIRAFRLFNIYSSSDAVHSTFLSSGSTQDNRSTHSFSASGLKKYDKGSLEGWVKFLNRFNFASHSFVLNLVPSQQEWPQSSLAFMLHSFSSHSNSIVTCDSCSAATFDILKNALQSEEQIVIFGTSFHFIQLWQLFKQNKTKPFFSEARILIVDTGGTKGRTQSVSSQQLRSLILELFDPQSNVQLSSEYGMCELASQAWSDSNYNADNFTFECNTSIAALSIYPSLTKANTFREKGFLGFIDENNSDSYGAVLTEDLGEIWEPQILNSNCVAKNGFSNSFALQGRAADSSLKGCSLNVKPHFSTEFSVPNFDPQESKSQPYIWQKYSSEDRDATLNSIQNLLPLGESNFQITLLDNTEIHIIASANVPVTWIYPCIAARELGAKVAYLRLPSLRNDDPLSKIVREQILSLIDSLALQLLPLKVEVSQELPDVNWRPLQTMESRRLLLVFGTDTTVQTFQSNYQSHFTQVIGLGDVRNAYKILPNTSIQETATMCSRWLGRGCLTPVALFLDPNIPFNVSEFSDSFKNEMSSRFLESDWNPEFSHSHLRHEIKCIFKNESYNPENYIYTCFGITIIQLQSFSFEVAQKFIPLALEHGGAGCVFIFNAGKIIESSFSFYETSPQYLDTHMGKTWSQWLNSHSPMTQNSIPICPKLC